VRIRLWNAFASNNSGSYTIVGTFRDAATAAAVAAELRALCEAESGWQRRQWDPTPIGGPRPLVTFAKQHGITGTSDLSTEADDDWPDLSYAPVPMVTHTTRQVVLHVKYTVTMPRVLGQLLYHRGGRVDVELDHAHERIVVVHEIHGDRNNPARAQKLAALFAALDAIDSPLRRLAAADVTPVLRDNQKEPWPKVRAMAVFTDLAEGVAAIGRLVTEHGLELHVRLLEAEPGDPLRPWRTT
jgi:hypothetical protein